MKNKSMEFRIPIVEKIITIWQAIRYFDIKDIHYRIVVNDVKEFTIGKDYIPEAYIWGTISEWTDPFNKKLYRLQIRDYNDNGKFDFQDFKMAR